ncbi:hypothetical protein [Nocardioides alcanivorans]|uniref:hypothetical protein n=1 Tax=Nocardioides alcanivorans TaxID=2897352 RepID=UPI001F39194E|nr:hypothetical protein [Nocardioides alcanivorans]
MHALLVDVQWAFTGFVVGIALFTTLMVSGLWLAAHSYDEPKRRKHHWHLPGRHA